MRLEVKHARDEEKWRQEEERRLLHSTQGRLWSNLQMTVTNRLEALVGISLAKIGSQNLVVLI